MSAALQVGFAFGFLTLLWKWMNGVDSLGSNQDHVGLVTNIPTAEYHIAW